MTHHAKLLLEELLGSPKLDEEPALSGLCSFVLGEAALGVSARVTLWVGSEP
jgi:hypothetical protein